MAADQKKSKLPLILGLVVVLVGGGVAAWLLMGDGREQPPTLFVNGFDFPVTVKATSESGDETIVEVPAKGRVAGDLAGKHTVEYLLADGTSMKKKTFKLTAKDKRKKRCIDIINVLGSAAIVQEDITFGIGIKGRGKMTSGHDFVKLCPRWGFETKAPPKAIKVKEGNMGMTLGWMHYMGDGDWVAAVDAQLAKKPQMGDQSRIRAWNIAFAVNKFDKDNPRLKAQGPKFKAACHKIVDMFTTGPLAGKAKKDCLRNTKAMFPDA